MEIEFASFTILVLNQSPINTIPLLTRFSGSPKFVLSGDPLYRDENSFVSRNIGISEYAEFVVLPEFLRNLNFFDKIQFQEFMY